MSTSRAALELSVVPESLPAEAVYTLCPVLVASHVAVHQGWLDAELAKVGARARYLWSLQRGYLRKDFDVALWADPTLLEEALAGRALS